MQFRNRFPRWLRRPAGPGGWAALAAAVTAAAFVLAALAGSFSGPGRTVRIHAANAALSQPAHHRAGQAGAGGAGAGGARHPRAAAAASRTSCTSVAHIGDSTSVGMVSPAVLPDPSQRLQAQYARVGVKHLLVDASGGRSIVEALPGQVNGYYTARGMASRGFHGCWVIALGTNDTANVAAGSAATRMARIGEMMAVAHGQPVLWVNTRTLDTSGFYAQASMRAWNATLLRATAKYPNLRIFDWASVARPAWYLYDGIHYTSAGYAARAHAIAGALAKAFPAAGHSTSRIVR